VRAADPPAGLVVGKPGRNRTPGLPIGLGDPRQLLASRSRIPGVAGVGVVAVGGAHAEAPQRRPGAGLARCSEPAYGADYVTGSLGVCGRQVTRP
jgi:hypothetical protein